VTEDYYAVTPETRKAADATVVSVIGTALKPLGYKKDANTWRKSNPETVEVLNIQKSSGGARLYINLGVLIRSIKDIEKPREYECHVRARLDARPEDSDKDDLGKALTYNNGESEDWRTGILTRAILQRAVPFLNRFETRASAETALRNLPLEVALIPCGAFHHLNIPEPENAFR
jgi:hypothetical protein